MWSRRRLSKTLAVAAAAPLMLVGAQGAAAALAPPSPEEWEDVTIREVVSAREVVVARSDGSQLRVRFPSVTVPEGATPEGAPVCGAAQARAALSKMLPVGRKATLEPVERDRNLSWVTVPNVDAAQYAADGALYADLTTASRGLQDVEGSVLTELAGQGWLRTDVRLAAAQADPSEVGLVTMGRFTLADVYAADAEQAGFGAYATCRGDFDAAAPPRVVATDWAVDGRGRVRAIGGLPLRAGLTVLSMQETFGSPDVSVGDNFCTARWPGRGLTVYPVAMTTNGGTEATPPPRTADECLSRRVTDVGQFGSGTRLDGLRPRTSLRRMQRKIPSLTLMRDNRAFAQVGRRASGSPNGSVWVGLDRKRRMRGLLVTLPGR